MKKLKIIFYPMAIFGGLRSIAHVYESDLHGTTQIVCICAVICLILDCIKALMEIYLDK